VAYDCRVVRFFALQYVFGENPAKEVSYSDFETRMLNTGAVERLVAYKKNDLVEVEVYLKKGWKDNQVLKMLQKLLIHFQVYPVKKIRVHNIFWGCFSWMF
jgi:hypothetical protein